MDCDVYNLGSVTVYKFGSLIFGLRGDHLTVGFVYPNKGEGPKTKTEHGIVKGTNKCLCGYRLTSCRIMRKLK